jgi:hypothetical protein
MPLTVRLESPVALYRKLERESYRAFHAGTPLHKADHFFNFCVTAASMRDYVLEHLKKISKSDKQPYYDDWNKVPALVAAAEIANSSKHFVLRDPRSRQPMQAKTRRVRLRKASVVNVYANDAGEFELVQAQRTEVSVSLSDGQVLELHSFTEQVLQYWRDYLRALGLPVRRQPFARLAGVAASDAGI